MVLEDEGREIDNLV